MKTGNNWLMNSLQVKALQKNCNITATYIYWWLRSLTKSVLPQALAKRLQHCGPQHLSGATVCARLATLLWCVATCWVLLVQVWLLSTMLPNIFAICFFEMLWSFGQDFTLKIHSIQGVILLWTTLLFSAALGFTMTLNKLIVYMYV